MAATALGACAMAGVATASGAMQFPRSDSGVVERAGPVFVSGGPQFEVDATDLSTGVSGSSQLGCPGQGKAKPALVVQLLDLAPGDGQVYAAVQIRPFTGKGEDADEWSTKPADTSVCQGILDRAAAAGINPATQTAMGIARAGVDLKAWTLMPALPMAANDTFFGLTTDATGAPWVKTGPSARDLAGAPFTRWDDATGAWVPGADAPAMVRTMVWRAPVNHQVMWLSGTTGLDITSVVRKDLMTVQAIDRTDADGATVRLTPRTDYRARVTGTGGGDPDCRLPGTVRVRHITAVTAASADGSVLMGDGPAAVRTRCLDRRRTVTAMLVWRPVRSTDGGATWRPYGIPASVSNPLWANGSTWFGTGPRGACDTGQAIRRWTGSRVATVGCAPGFLVY